ncbi:basic salivary proline-rich protein 1-like [Sarcophilus harrisii]|uniref:basic salivary proline-rich protein 1-like n=1 Tax=Sarcophilus harrisii TaxID=9305 RepID=UPI001301C7A2|nr:basic salivary proline-rich protein 1-like [Sarcophilus harrisii]
MTARGPPAAGQRPEPPARLPGGPAGGGDGRPNPSRPGGSLARRPNRARDGGTQQWLPEAGRSLRPGQWGAAGKRPRQTAAVLRPLPSAPPEGPPGRPSSAPRPVRAEVPGRGQTPGGRSAGAGTPWLSRLGAGGWHTAPPPPMAGPCPQRHRIRDHGPRPRVGMSWPGASPLGSTLTRDSRGEGIGEESTDTDPHLPPPQAQVLSSRPRQIWDSTRTASPLWGRLCPCGGSRAPAGVSPDNAPVPVSQPI